eukprot:gnl/TRDRNA2_/TRDRNA2_62014_c0_seq1.p1 gnl/TRDRNA2_/TRDRNA2_62014_c0~~gnl/TRDRNA2_/TRDRNA2_62014_c0_seq1.p1  ORF type:complete len:441 (-),score=67.37 gnl/TRDRNA2_/TRDRNA2_62014_c0_seq1:36-1358(-)
MSEPRLTLSEPLLHEVFDVSVPRGKKVLTRVSLLVGLSLAVLVSGHTVRRQHLADLDPAFSAALRYMQPANTQQFLHRQFGQPARLWQPMQPMKVANVQAAAATDSAVGSARKVAEGNAAAHAIVNRTKSFPALFGQLEEQAKGSYVAAMHPTQARVQPTQATQFSVEDLLEPQLVTARTFGAKFTEAVRDTEKLSVEDILGTLNATAEAGRRVYFWSAAADPLLQSEQKEDAHSSFNPLEKLFFWRFALAVAKQLGDPRVQPAKDYASLMAQINKVAASPDLRSIQLKSKAAFNDIFPDWLLTAYRMVFGPFEDFSALLIGEVTKFGSQWLMGPSDLATMPREDGSGGKNLVLKIEKCRFLEESGPCVKTCLHACKVPTEEFFSESMGLPVTLRPNMTSLGCEMVFGVAPLPLDQDPVAATPCFATCSQQARHTDVPCK